MSLPLEGIRVLDLSRTLPGPFCTMILADMGADVIRLEEVQPRHERPMVRLPNETLTKERGYDSVRRFFVTDRNKRSIALDLKAAAGREVFHALVKGADVVVEEYRPGVAQRLGVGYDVLKGLNPRLIYCAITGYGQTSPWRMVPGHDPNYLGMAGALSLCGTPDGQPSIPGFSVSALAAGANAALAILIAYIARSKTGRGQFIDISMVDSVLYMVAARHGSQFFATGEQPPMGSQPPHVYTCADDRPITIAVGEPWFWERTCKVLSLEEYTPYLDHILPFPLGGPKRQEILDALARAFKTKPRDEWLRLLIEADVPAAPANTLKEAFAHPHALARQMVLQIESPEWGLLTTVGIPFKMSNTPGAVRGSAPHHGQHTAEVLRDAGYTDKEIGTLRASGAIK